MKNDLLVTVLNMEKDGNRYETDPLCYMYSTDKMRLSMVLIFFKVCQISLWKKAMGNIFDILSSGYER